MHANQVPVMVHTFIQFLHQVHTHAYVLLIIACLCYLLVGGQIYLAVQEPLLVSCDGASCRYVKCMFGKDQDKSTPVKRGGTHNCRIDETVVLDVTGDPQSGQFWHEKLCVVPMGIVVAAVRQHGAQNWVRTRLVGT